jgi:hypothetical protein
MKYGPDDALVFAHPHTGKPIDRARLLAARPWP